MKDDEDKKPPRPAGLEPEDERELSDEPGDDVSAEDVASIAAALGNALAPRALSADLHEAILARALGLPDRQVSGERAASEPPYDRAESRRAEELRDALDVNDVAHPLVALATSARLAVHPRALPELVQARHVRDALRAPSRVVAIRAFTLVGLVTAAAAAVALFVAKPREEVPSAALPREQTVSEFLPGMTESRSTTTLFEPEDFPQGGGERARIDRITEARKAELRRNQFVAWGAP